MSTTRYAGACLAVVGWGCVGAAVLLDRANATGVLAAGAVALPVQVGAFALLARARPGTRGFAQAWVGGMLARMVLVGLAGWALVALPDLPPLSTLLALATFLFVMLLLEPRFLGLGGHRG